MTVTAAQAQFPHRPGASRPPATARGEFNNARFARVLLFMIGLYSAVVAPLSIEQTVAGANNEVTNWVNQAAWLSFAAVAVLILLMNPARFLTRPVLRSHIVLLVLMGWFVLSAAWSLSPEATIRRIGLQFVIMLAVWICVVLIRDARTVFDDMLRLLFLVVIVNWMALAALPPTSAGHAGIYLSKNNFGTAAALMVLLGASCIGAGTWMMRLMALFVVASGLVFLVISAAKTSIGLALLVPALSILILKFPLHRAHTGVVVALLGFALFLSSVAIIALFNATTDDLLTLLFGDPTFTGRTSIWAFVWPYVESRPWLGYGFGGFWSIGTAAPVMQAGWWWMRDVINQSHNLYLDLLIQGGVVALVLFLAHVGVMIWKSGRLAGWRWSDKMSIACIILYCLIYNLMDTTLFRSFNLDWIYFLSASVLIGLGPLASPNDVTRFENGSMARPRYFGVNTGSKTRLIERAPSRLR